MSAMPVRPRIKICGVTTPDIARVAVDAGADAIGLVFAPRSPRYVQLDAAITVAAAIPAYVHIVGVFASPAQVTADVLNEAPLTLLQIHGPVTPPIVAELAPRRVVAALTFTPDTFADTLAKWSDASADTSNLAGLLIDAPDPTGVGGGAGETFDWAALRRVIDDVRPTPPLILAGGLTPTNVAEAIAVVQPYAVDVSSGVESSRGVKDPQRIRDFCAAAR
ncbi:MAG: N-(5'-phosphoribosyl)anthranilate isomerase [Phycisphaera sp.]|nr:N-(5'-phosphoribosyl)anthranilate isomerase [Phycisphaera sp.]